MALFAAFASEVEENTLNEQSTDWLKNSSFKIDLSTVERSSKPINDPVIECSSEQFTVVSQRSINSNHLNLLYQKNKLDPLSDEFVIDTCRTKEFLTVDKIHGVSAPRYKSRYRLGGYGPWRKQRKSRFKRYYCFARSSESSNSGKTDKSEKDQCCDLLMQGTDLTENTAYFNRELTRDPYNTKVWLQYVKFQDVVYRLQRSNIKGSIAKGQRLMAEKKLSILDKALGYNPECESLLRERLSVSVSVFPADELQVQIRKLLDKDQANIILWQGYIESYQCSMSHCTAPKLLKLYIKCLAALHKLRRSASVDRATLEQNILRMLYQCGLFLKQAGLFEQLWTVLRLYLELNLTPGMSDNSVFNISSDFNERELVDLEDMVFKSNLPLHELWLRTEKLRESCHWLPVPIDSSESSSACTEDPQRIVLMEDVSDLIHPITMEQNCFKLTATILTLLKVPLLPLRHTTFQQLGLDCVPWALDSVEPLLPIYWTAYPCLDIKHDVFIDNRLAVGPQYIKALPGQYEYLRFVLKTMQSCFECSQSSDQLVTTVWWIRFQQMLAALQRSTILKLADSQVDLSKLLRSNVKSVLKMERNRSNILLYCEYALLELELGNEHICMAVLETALKMSPSKHLIVANINKPSGNIIEQAYYCKLQRTIVELYMRRGNHKYALRQLVQFAVQLDESTPTMSESLTTEELENAELKFKHVFLLMLGDGLKEPLHPSQHFLPVLATEWVMLYTWFIYLKSNCNAVHAGAHLESVLEQWTNLKCDSYLLEVIYEFYVAILLYDALSRAGSSCSFSILNDVLMRSVPLFPNNVFVLSAIVKQQSVTGVYGGGMIGCSKSGLTWWKLKSTIISTDRPLPILFLVLIGINGLKVMHSNIVDTFTGKSIEVDDSTKNRMLSLFRRITNAEMTTRRCGLLWRLYLQFVHAYFDPGLCRKIYYTAVEECPWLKALYIDAAIYIPAELAQIQDLLVEKQLRLHVTPEELIVLRS